MRIVGLDHIQLAMPAGAEAVARQFYGQLLGFEEMTKPQALSGRGGCWFQASGVHLHLGVDADFAPARKAHPAFLVSDLAACEQRFTAAGIVVTSDASVAGVRRFYASDPFGNRLEFIQDGGGFSQHKHVGT